MSGLSPSSPNPVCPANRRELRRFLVAAGVLTVCFLLPLYRLVSFAGKSDLYSYILLVPFISAYLAWSGRRTLRLDVKPNLGFGLVLGGAGLALVAAYFWALHSGWRLLPADHLACITLAYLLFLAAAAGCFLGRGILRQLAFPVGFLSFMVPFPTLVEKWVESFLQHGSAEVAYYLFVISGTPIHREGMIFQLPGFALEVAPQCSGIHASVVLFITCLLAAYLLLRQHWSRVVLMAAIIPLGLLRNGFRIFVLGQLCVHVDPAFIDSALHRRGGPIFFVLSLVPFFLLVYLLRKLENRQPHPVLPSQPSPSEA